ncbi:DUF6445 family protein [Thalassotalea hakodatensis]|uniref:DUF6445 family protein n=1 Tax=Thalassotalea hakodatensis TaxID=3030492 RepID=UPI00257482BB|nr:DUF6445 family protein [Thalassotalea hakodatensis]
MIKKAISDDLSFNTDVTPNVEYIGNEGSPILVFDNISVKPELLVSQFLKNQNKAKPARGKDNYYPGDHLEVESIYADNLNKLLAPYIKKYFNLPAAYLERIFCDFSIVNTPEEQLTPLQALPHYDSHGSGNLAGIHFLCDPPYLGTGFYRHQETGIELMSRKKVNNYLKALEQHIESPDFEKKYISGHIPHFDLIHTIPAKFNRLVIYRSQALHTALIDNFLLNNPVDNGRLTLRSFLFY